MEYAKLPAGVTAAEVVLVAVYEREGKKKKSSSFEEGANPHSSLDGHQRQALQELQVMLEKAILGNSLFETDQAEEAAETEKKPGRMAAPVSLWGVPLLCGKGSEGASSIMLKFLRARQFDVEAAFELLRSVLQWRKDAREDSILDEGPLGEGLEASANLGDSADREGRPVLYDTPGAFRDAAVHDKAFGSEEKVERFVRWRVSLMEEAARRLDFGSGGVDSIVQVTDVKGFRGSSMVMARETLTRVDSLLHDKYPELVSQQIFINTPFWWHACFSFLFAFLKSEVKSKLVSTRPKKVTETLLKCIPAEEIPARYGGLKREKDPDFSAKDLALELVVKAGSTEKIAIPMPEAGILLWDLTVVGWEVTYGEEYVPEVEDAYIIVLRKDEKMGADHEGPVRNSCKYFWPGKMVLTIQNNTSKKKVVLFRYKAKVSAGSGWT